MCTEQNKDTGIYTYRTMTPRWKHQGQRDRSSQEWEEQRWEVKQMTLGKDRVLQNKTGNRAQTDGT